MNFFNFYFPGQDSTNPIQLIIDKLTTLEAKMATIQDIMEEARANTDIMKAGTDAIFKGLAEIRQLLAKKDIDGADALIAEMQEARADFVQAVFENTELTAQVDAVNGDPVA